MLLWTTLKIALNSLAMNKLRSLLTMLGVIIGVGAVIAMLSLGSAFGTYISRQVSSMGTNVLFVRAGQFRHGPMSTIQTLTPADGEAILKQTSARAVSPTVMSNATIKADNKASSSASVMGIAPSLFQIQNVEIAEGGRAFGDDELANQSRVAILGPKTAKDLFGDLDPLGRTVRIGNLPFRVIGVTVPLGEQGGFNNPDDRVLVPYTTAMYQIPPRRDYVQSLVIGAYEGTDLSQLQQEITDLLRRRHRLAEGEEDDFGVMNMAEALRTLQGVTLGLTLFLGTVASISLIVGGIGIMNIMLATVAERTREIGIRKAIGAKDRDILRQFLIEALVITLGGGLVGLLLGWGLMNLTAAVLKQWLALAPSMQWWVVAMAIGISTMVGLVSGLYPAYRASRLNPVEALRYE